MTFSSFSYPSLHLGILLLFLSTPHTKYKQISLTFFMCSYSTPLTKLILKCGLKIILFYSHGKCWIGHLCCALLSAPPPHWKVRVEGGLSIWLGCPLAAYWVRCSGHIGRRLWGLHSPSSSWFILRIESSLRKADIGQVELNRHKLEQRKPHRNCSISSIRCTSFHTMPSSGLWV